jgi:hypothetical protein
VAEGTEPWRGCLRDGGRAGCDAVAMARGLRGCCKRRDRAGDGCFPAGFTLIRHRAWSVAATRVWRHGRLPATIASKYN